jgi:hypothetical protein
MAWERRWGRLYYYRSVWCDGRVKKRYFGNGPAGELAARLDAEARRNRQEPLSAIRDLQERLRLPDAALTALEATCALLLEATLRANGYHRPKGRAWRRRRVSGCRTGKPDSGC